MWLKLTAEAVPPAVPGARGARRRRHLPRPVLRRPPGRARHGRAARGVPAAPVHRPAVPAPRRPRLRAGRDGPLRRAVRRHARASRRTPGTPPPSARRCSATSARVVAALGRKVARLAEVERFEEAAVHRDRLAAFVRAAARMQRLSALTGCAELVAARPARRRRLGDRRGPARPAGGHRGRRPGRGPAGRRRVPGRTPPRSSRPGTGRRRRPRPRRPSACCAGSRPPGTRLVSLTGTWASPTYGAGGVRLWAEAAEQRPRPARPVRRPPRHPAGAPAGRRGQPDRLCIMMLCALMRTTVDCPPT